MLYFAYGSNLDWDQMRDRCPSARFVTVAELMEHCLAFTRKSFGRNCGVADVVPKAGASVWGVVYQIDELDLGVLDKKEGYRPGCTNSSYVREERPVYADGDGEKPLTVFVYMAVREPSPPLPSAEYKQLIVQGAKQWHLPESYVKELERIEISG